ncbi:putative tyrosyl-dna phosphodiesterase [Lasius niger]|uniref:Putative tyrosyl-dna phosphodiesterase n=1 Tax=Lasius niger TaxID=67767 RepID=A0A0J7KB45_LASNI|nr:putative tyrosyl-dna phosphodiesterase [Lasius niger]
MSHPHLEKLLINQLDGTIEIPKVLHFACNDRSQLLDQLKVLQMVLRKEREKNQDNPLTISSLSSEIQSLSTATSDIKEDLKEKVERHKNAMLQKKQDKLKQMDAEAQALSKALINKDCESSEGTKAKKRSQESSSAAPFVTNKMKRMSIESSSYAKDSQRNISDSQSSSTSNEQNASSKTATSIMDMYQACDSEKTRKEVRKRAIQMMRHSGYTVSVVEPGEFALKYAFSAPYHLFFTRIEKSKETYNQQFSITFPEILDRSLGEIVNSLHINFMVDGCVCSIC